MSRKRAKRWPTRINTGVRRWQIKYRDGTDIKTNSARFVLSSHASCSAIEAGSNIAYRLRNCRYDGSLLAMVY